MTQAAIGSPDRGAIVGARTWRARLSPAVTPPAPRRVHHVLYNTEYKEIHMNNKDKKQLKGMASLMPSVVQIGKDGLSDAVIDSARAAITARELIKAHVLNNANLPTKETMEDLADMLGAELIQVIGHYGVLFKKKDKKSHFEFIKD